MLNGNIPNPKPTTAMVRERCKYISKVTSPELPTRMTACQEACRQLGQNNSAYMEYTGIIVGKCCFPLTGELEVSSVGELN